MNKNNLLCIDQRVTTMKHSLKFYVKHDTNEIKTKTISSKMNTLIAQTLQH